MSRDASRIAVLAEPGLLDDDPVRPQDESSILILDTRTGIVAATVALGQTKPRYVALDRDGKRMAVYPEVARDAPPERYAIEVFDLVTQGPPIRLVARERTRTRGVEVRTPLAFVGQGDFLLAGGWIGPLAVWDLNQQRLVDSSDLEGVTSIAVSPNARYLVAAGVDGSIRVLRVSGLHKGPKLEGHEGGVTAVAFSADSRWVATGGEDGRVRMSATATGRLLLTLDLSADNSPIEALTFGDDGSLAVATQNRLQIFRPGGLGAVRTLGALTEPVAMAASEQYYAAVYQDSTVQLWDVSSLRPLSSWNAQDNGVLDMDISTDGNWLVTGGGQLGDSARAQANSERYLTVYLWSTESGERVAAFGGHDQAVTTVDFASESRRVASGSLDGTVRLWDTVGLEALNTIHVGEAVFAVRWSDDEALLAVGTRGGRTLLYDPDSGSLAQELFGAQSYDQGSQIWISEDGGVVAMGNRSDAEELVGVLWQLPDIQPRLRLEDDSIIGLRSDGGRFLVRSGSSLQVWASERLQPAFTLTVPEDGVPLSAAFGPNGLDLVATTDQRLVIWRALPADQAESANPVDGPRSDG
jgi:WD40 repeat protein